MDPDPIDIWWIRDGRAGHENQVRGLIGALHRLIPVQTHDVAPLSRTSALMVLAHGKRPQIWRDLPAPSLIIGAGHDTHLTLLAAKRITGGTTIVLMKPTLSVRLFDACLIPAHDRPVHAPNVLITRGVLNAVEPGPPLEQRPREGLFLLGGPSGHYTWDTSDVVAQVATILKDDSCGIEKWWLTTSRRTPPEALEEISHDLAPRLCIMPAHRTPPGWVASRLSQSRIAWVSRDSVSMVYEALTAGAMVGLLDLPVKRRSRVVADINNLCERGDATPFEAWRDTHQLRPPLEPLNEAVRCAAWIREQLLET